MRSGHIASSQGLETRTGLSRAVVEDGWVFVAGTTGFDHDAMTIAESAVEQCEQAFRNIDAALHKAGAAMEQVVRVTYVVPNPEDWDHCLPVANRWLGRAMPAATMISASLQDPRIKIEIEVTARLPD